MTHKIADVVWLRAEGKAAVVIAVDRNKYVVRTYNGILHTVSDKALGK